jgi:hypothetical protein
MQQHTMVFHYSLVTAEPAAHIVVASKPLVDALLAMNTSNRKVRRTHVENLKDEIKSGRFMLTASGIGISKDGVLLDGQHRLIALAELGYPPVFFLLLTGLDKESQAVVDRHAKRSLADALTLVQGRTVGTLIVAASNAMLLISNSKTYNQDFVYAGRQPSDAAAAKNLAEWWDDLTAVLPAVGTEVRASVSAALAIYYRHEPDNAIELCDQIKRGIGLQEFWPAYKLRDALKSCGSGGAQASIRAFSLTVTACIAHSSGSSLKLIKPSLSWARKPWKGWKA